MELPYSPQLIEEVEARLRNMEPSPPKDDAADDEKDPVRSRQPIVQLVQRSSFMEKPKVFQSSTENPQSDHSWLDKLPEARISLNLESKIGRKKPMFQGRREAHHQTKTRTPTAHSVGTMRSSFETLQEYDDYDSSDDLALDEMDGTTIHPEWDDIKTFVKLYSPDKASCKRYEVGMASANIKADMKGEIVRVVENEPGVEFFLTRRSP